MKPGELRIGNYYDDGAGPFQLEADRIPSYIYGGYMPLPIKLTEEILKCTSFQEKDGYWSIKGLNSFQLTKPNLGQESFMAVKKVETSYYVVKMNVSYLHELQNLVFALEGKELPVKICKTHQISNP